MKRIRQKNSQLGELMEKNGEREKGSISKTAKIEICVKTKQQVKIKTKPSSIKT